MDPQNLKVIKQGPIPKNLHDLISFLGMCSYYRRFIEKISLLAGSLHDLTKKKVKYQWTSLQQEPFDTLKEKLTSQLVLIFHDLSKPFEIHCDACGDCLGAIFLQDGHAIAYESCSLHEQE